MSDEERDRSRDRDRSKRDRPSRFSDQTRDRSMDRGRDRGGTKSSQCRVYVSNIPYEYRWQDLKDLFRNQVGDVSFVELFVDDNDKARGCGIVEFSEPSSVRKCLEIMHRFELKGRKLVIKEDFGNQRDKYGNIIGGKRGRDRDEGRDRYRDRGNYDMQSNRSSSDGGDKWGNTYGLSPQFLESLGINVPLISRVFVANLDYKVDKKKLKEVFRLAGKVQRVELSSDRDGKSRGFAVVEYDHPVEAVQAISMFHNQMLYERTMTVRMDREVDRGMAKLPDGLKGVGMGLGLNGEPLKDVARNLPSISNNSNQQSSSNSGAGLLGAMPNPPLGIGGALSNLNSGVGSSALNNAAVLQAAGLTGVGGLSSNLLANTLSTSDLELAAASLVNNPLVQNHQSFATLANTGSLSANPLSSSNFSRTDGNNSYLTAANQNSNTGGYQNSLIQQRGGYDDQKNSTFNLPQIDRGNRNQTDDNVYSTMNNGSQLLRSSNNLTGNKNSASGYSHKILVSNLPPTASFKMLMDKCKEFGNVQRFEDRNNGTLLVTFSTEWEAESAIKNMDRARIDGRTIDVRFFY